MHGNADELSKSYRVECSPESQLLWQIMNYINQANVVIGDLAQREKYNKENLSKAEYEVAHAQTDSIFTVERVTINLMLTNFIEDNAGSLATLYAIDAPFNRSMRVFYEQSDFEMFETVLDGLEAQCPDNPHTQFYRNRVERVCAARMLEQQ